MMIIGVDPHKSTHTATAVDPQTNRALHRSALKPASPTTAGC